MKKLILSIALTSALSTNAFADLNQVGISLIGGASWIALSAFAPVAAGVMLGSTLGGLSTVLTAANETVRKQVQELVNNDAQGFYIDGSISPALGSGINQLKDLDNTLTDAEAVDLLVEAVNKF